ncbi:MAG: NAD(P)-dependent oxidoreductase [Alphaproteobacteria bacterium]|nr:MAG: NAD(P)-dependent oxidoreductase [Alphaproteobacteria bacterium]
MSEVTGQDHPRVGIVGLGRMGAGIARNLERAGMLTGAHDISEAALRAAGLGPAVRLLPAPELLDSCGVVLFAVPTTRQIGEALADADPPAGRVIVDLTTSAPAQSRALAARLAKSGVHYVDAAMTGGAAGADAGTLTLMAGGEAEAIAVCRPVFAAIAARVFHLGPVGSGHAMKLVHNLILHSHFLAVCEGLGLAERAGLDVNRAVEVLNAGNARSFVTETRFPRDILGGRMNARSTIANLAKDLALATEFGEELGAPLPYARLTSGLLEGAVAAGRAGTDFAWLYPLFADLVRNMETPE